MMSNILLFYPSFQNAEQGQSLYVDVPLSVATLISRLSQKRHSIEIFDQRIEHPFDFKKLQYIDIVGISITTSQQIINGLNFARQARAYKRDIKFIWGGWHASLMPQETIKNEFVDILIIGQGEYIFPLVIDAVENHCLHQVPNILYKDSSGSVHENIIQDYIDMPIPQSMIPIYPFLKMEQYIHAEWGKKRILGYESSRGCVNACGFCSISSIFKRKWYGIPAENIYCDLLYLKEQYSIDAVHFFDNNFFVDKQRAFQFAAKMEENSLDLQWDGTVVVKQFLNFTSCELEKLKRGGLYRIIAGIESGDKEVLRNINKYHTNEQVIQLVKRCREFEIMPSLSFMIGFPWNPEQDIKNTIRLIEKIKEIYNKTEILLFIFSPYLGTPLYHIALEHGMRAPSSLDEWAQFTYEKTNTPWMTQKLQKKADRYVKFFGTKELSENEHNFYVLMNKKDS